jgi:hypothetical protein
MSVAGVPSQFSGAAGGDAARAAIQMDPRILAAGPGIDALMEKASQMLVACDYFGASEACERALDKARRVKDFERIARICMPLQEARRQIRQIAVDAGRTRVLNVLPARGTPLEPGLYLLEPPLIGLDGNTFRQFAFARRVPVLAIAKEPTTSAGRWPVVGVGRGEFENVVARTQVEPPASLVGHAGPLVGMDPSRLPDGAWMLAAQEAIGDAAIRKVRPEWPAAHRVEDLIELLDAVPDHEKLAQALEATAREALTAPTPQRPRRRPFVEDPYSF